MKKNFKRQNLIITKADKGNTVVVMDKSDYIERTEKILLTEDFQKVQKDPLNKMKREVDDVLKKSAHVIDGYVRKRLRMDNPEIPRLYSLPKIHKEGEKMRPIVSNINSPVYDLSKWLNNTFKGLNEFESLAIKNNFNFTEKVGLLKLQEDEVLVSFDVEALFPSVPVESTLNLLRKWLEENDLMEATVN